MKAAGSQRAPTCPDGTNAMNLHRKQMPSLGLSQDPAFILQLEGHRRHFSQNGKFLRKHFLFSDFIIRTVVLSICFPIMENVCNPVMRILCMYVLYCVFFLN